MNTPTLPELLRMAKEHVDAMTPEQREAMHEAQCQSWVRGEIGMGSDADEAVEKDKAYRRAELKKFTIIDGDKK